jgi:hypothetical protein
MVMPLEYYYTSTSTKDDILDESSSGIELTPVQKFPIQNLPQDLQLAPIVVVDSNTSQLKLLNDKLQAYNIYATYCKLIVSPCAAETDGYDDMLLYTN